MPNKKIWNDNHQKLYKRLYTKLKDTYPNIEEETYIKTLPKTSIKKIINKLDLSISSKESFVYGCSLVRYKFTRTYNNNYI